MVSKIKSLQIKTTIKKQVLSHSILKLAEYLKKNIGLKLKDLCFLFAPNALLTAKKANTSAVVTGCCENNTLYKALDTCLDLDNKEYSLTLENREKI